MSSYMSGEARTLGPPLRSSLNSISKWSAYIVKDAVNTHIPTSLEKEPIMMILLCQLCADGEDWFSVLLSTMDTMGKGFPLSYMPLLDP